MDGLRLALLIIGIVIVAAVYWNARRRNAAEIRNSDLSERIEPGFESPEPTPAPEPLPLDLPGDPPMASDDVADDAAPEAPRAEAGGENGEAEESRDEVPQKVISMRIVGKNGKDFSAEDVALTLRGVGLQHGRFGIFHRMPDDDSEDAVFSVANLTEPGNFDLSDLKDKRFAGLSFFMLRPGPGRGVDAFDKMVEAARAVAITLQGELLDGDGSTLSIQRERFMREDLIQYELKHLKL